MRQRSGCLANLFWLAVVGVVGGALLYTLVAVTDPWALHIGGRWTPLLTWWGSGTLHTQGGSEYPLFLYFHPASEFSRFRLDGLRPTGGMQGTACLCTSRD